MLQRRLPAYCTVNNKSIARSFREAILPLYMALVRPCLDTLCRFVPFSFTQKEADIDALLWAEQNVTKMVRGWSMSLCRERLRESGFVQPGEEKAKGVLVAISIIQVGEYRED